MIELLPCPFCGSSNIVYENDDPYTMECRGCGAIGPKVTDTPSCVELWNTRVQRDSSNKELEEAFWDFYKAFCAVSTHYNVVQPGVGLIKKHLQVISAVEVKLSGMGD